MWENFQYSVYTTMAGWPIGDTARMWCLHTSSDMIKTYTQQEIDAITKQTMQLRREIDDQTTQKLLVVTDAIGTMQALDPELREAFFESDEFENLLERFSTHFTTQLSYEEEIQLLDAQKAKHIKVQLRATRYKRKYDNSRLRLDVNKYYRAIALQEDPDGDDDAEGENEIEQIERDRIRNRRKNIDEKMRAEFRKLIEGDPEKSGMQKMMNTALVANSLRRSAADSTAAAGQFGALVQANMYPSTTASSYHTDPAKAYSY